MKFCPNCGNKNKESAKFCTNCGYNLKKHDNAADSLHSTNSEKKTIRRRIAKEQNKSHKSTWVIATIVLLCVIAGGYYFLNIGSKSASSSNTATTQSANTSVSTGATNDSIATQNSGSNDTDIKLSSDIGPKETAAAIAYYADKSGLDGWENYLKANNGITIILDSDDTAMVSEKGQGMIYGVLNEQQGSNSLPKNVYTLDEDNTVNIYHLSNEDDSDNPATPIKSISKDEIIQYINNHGYASDVKKLGSKVTLDQEAN